MATYLAITEPIPPKKREMVRRMRGYKSPDISGDVLHDHTLFEFGDDVSVEEAMHSITKSFEFAEIRLSRIYPRD